MDPLAGRGDPSGSAGDFFRKFLDLGEFLLQAPETGGRPNLPVTNIGQRGLKYLEPALPLVPLLDIGQHCIDVHRDRPASSPVGGNQAFGSPNRPID
jgi:hypothetical protein